MNVLSLFDGMSCGQLALNRAGIKYSKYFAAEIDKHAIEVTQSNYPDTIQLGDVNDVGKRRLPRIHLLIGGSPCQGFSFAGKQLNFEDPRSKLFFKFVDYLRGYRPKYFLLENVKMKKEYQDIITQYLGVEPIEINSARVSAQTRKRLYWTNIPFEKHIKNKGIVLKDILEEKVDEKYYVKKEYDKDLVKHNAKRKDPMSSYRIYNYGKGAQGNRIYSKDYKSVCLSALGGGRGAKTGLYMIGNRVRRLTPIECERLQTVPDNYTALASDSQRYKMLGNGWTIDVVAHILRGIQ